MSRYLITGATGFIGQHLVRHLSSEGHDLVALCRDPGAAVEGASVRRGDVLDPAGLADAAAGCEGVFHCAGKVSRNPDDAEELYRLHVEGTRNVLEACRAAGVRRAVVVSSSGTVAVSEDPDHISNEDDEVPMGLISRWPYYRAKLFAERAALAMSADGFEVVAVNPTLLLGPGDVHGSSTEDVRLFLEKRIPAVPPGGMSYVDARDAALALALAMKRGTPGRRYLVGACNLTIREFLGRLERVSGVRAPWIRVPRAPELSRVGTHLVERALGRLGMTLPVDPISLDMAQYYWYLDATRAENELGWASRDPMVTLSDTVEDLRGRGVVWS